MKQIGGENWVFGQTLHSLAMQQKIEEIRATNLIGAVDLALILTDSQG